MRWFIAAVAGLVFLVSLSVWLTRMPTEETRHHAGQGLIAPEPGPEPGFNVLTD